MAERRVPRGHAAAAACALLGAALAGCGDSGDEVVDGASGLEIEGTKAMLQLPHGQLEFTVSDSSTLDEDQVGTGDAPDGEYVGVDWEWTPGKGVPDLLSGFLIADDVPAEVRVRVDDAMLDLGPAYSTTEGTGPGGPRFVAAGDDVTSADVTVEVELDGATQSIRGDGNGLDAGPAEPLYDLHADPTAVPCELETEPGDVSSSPECEVATVSLPYVTDLGWAEEGGTWLVVDTSVVVPSLRVGDDTVPVLRQDETVTLEEAEPAAVLHREAGSGGVLRTQTVFPAEQGVDAGLEFTRTLRYTAPGGDLQEARLRGALTVSPG